MTLPKDAIRGAKEGTTAPLQQFTKQQERKRAQDKMEVPAPLAPGQVPPTDDSRGRKGRGKKGREAGATDGEKPRKSGLAGMASARAARNRTQRTSPAIRRRSSRMTRKGTNTAAPRKGSIIVEMPCTIREFSSAVGISANDILRALMGMGISVTNMNNEIDFDVAEMIVQDAGVDLSLIHI